MKSETIKKLVDEFKGEQSELGDYIANAIETDKTLHQELRSITRDEQDEEERHKKAVGEINARRVDLQKQCPHLETTYYPDASGNNDSEHICDLCGRRAHRHEGLFDNG